MKFNFNIINSKRKLFSLLIGLLLSLSVKAQTLLIFGGDKHDVFLGCLNCNKYESSSIWNKYGENGSNIVIIPLSINMLPALQL
jgi:hypothetical protein